MYFCIRDRFYHVQIAESTDYLAFDQFKDSGTFGDSTVRKVAIGGFTG